MGSVCAFNLNRWRYEILPPPAFWTIETGLLDKWEPRALESLLPELLVFVSHQSRIGFSIPSACRLSHFNRIHAHSALAFFVDGRFTKNAFCNAIHHAICIPSAIFEYQVIDYNVSSNFAQLAFRGGRILTNKRLLQCNTPAGIRTQHSRCSSSFNFSTSPDFANTRFHAFGDFCNATRTPCEIRTPA